MPALRTKILLTDQSRVRSCWIATSCTVTCSSVSSRVTRLSSSSPSTRVSPARCSKRRMLSRPVVTTAPASMLVTRVIGQKMRRRGCTSTTRPSTRGAWLPCRRATTTSRTLPTWSPRGSNTAMPARRAMKTLVGAPLMLAGYPPRGPTTRTGNTFGGNGLRAAGLPSALIRRPSRGRSRSTRSLCCPSAEVRRPSVQASPATSWATVRQNPPTASYSSRNAMAQGPGRLRRSAAAAARPTPCRRRARTTKKEWMNVAPPSKGRTRQKPASVPSTRRR